ncbi:hypothetical protein CUJ84_Chr000155 [Rhizobium leguminosarum]|uniref:Uncharacterized protein n=1 Tax=Rhizobium leguminosarum TaxID=384 RepID=A0A2K9YX91_RHILE|nr:hypothetical protein CUJ84_Chr000155 [Rhizobium leguminosarum]
MRSPSSSTITTSGTRPPPASATSAPSTNIWIISQRWNPAIRPRSKPPAARICTPPARPFCNPCRRSPPKPPEVGRGISAKRSPMPAPHPPAGTVLRTPVNGAKGYAATSRFPQPLAGHVPSPRERERVRVRGSYPRKSDSRRSYETFRCVSRYRAHDGR